MLSMTTLGAMMRCMTDRPYHHGRLRVVLLAEAERTLREQGIEGLSLRDLARQAGVSHAAAIDGAGEDYQARLRAVATAYVHFATRDAALLELMFAAKNAGPPDAVRDASERLFTAFGDLIVQGQKAGTLPPGDPGRLGLLLVATMQGIAALVTSGRAPAGQVDALITDAVALFTRSQR
jgi:AcrR family transcriptional regulator